VLINPRHRINQGLVCALLFNEGAGLTTYSLVGGPLANGTLAGNYPIWTTGRFGNALDFGTDSTTRVVTGDITPSLSPSSHVSIVSWLRGTNTGARQDAIGPRVDPNDFSVGIGIHTDGTIKYNISKAGIADQIITAAMTSNEWAHVVATYNGATLIAYKNGAYANEVNANATTLSADAVSLGWVIGIVIYNSSNYYQYGGLIDHVLIYNRVLLPGEVSYLYTNPFGSPSHPTMLVNQAPYPFFLSGTICWGHDTGVEEANIRDFNGNWSGTALVSGSGDAEELHFDIGEYEESETWNIGAHRVKITIDKYASGYGTPTVEYKNGATQVACEADSWHAYIGPFVCSGWIKVRVECN